MSHQSFYKFQTPHQIFLEHASKQKRNLDELERIFRTSYNKQYTKLKQFQMYQNYGIEFEIANTKAFIYSACLSLISYYNSLLEMNNQIIKYGTPTEHNAEQSITSFGNLIHSIETQVDVLYNIDVNYKHNYNVSMLIEMAKNEKLFSFKQ